MKKCKLCSNIAPLRHRYCYGCKTEAHRLAKQRDYRKNIVKRKRSIKRWYQNNKQKSLDRSKEWAQKNRDRTRESVKKYSAVNRIRISDRILTRENIKNETTFTSCDWKKILEAFNYLCFYCGKSGTLTQDHILPLTKGGKHETTNIVPACKSCNSSKGDRLFVYWAYHFGNRLTALIKDSA